MGRGSDMVFELFIAGRRSILARGCQLMNSLKMGRTVWRQWSSALPNYGKSIMTPGFPVLYFSYLTAYPEKSSKAKEVGFLKLAPGF